MPCMESQAESGDRFVVSAAVVSIPAPPRGAERSGMSLASFSFGAPKDVLGESAFTSPCLLEQLAILFRGDAVQRLGDDEFAGPDESLQLLHRFPSGGGDVGPSGRDAVQSRAPLGFLHG